MAEQRETLNNRKDEVSRMDKRICELQQRLQRKRSLNQQLANQINAATSAKQTQLRNNCKNASGLLRPQNIAAVEPYNHTPTKDHAHDDLHADLHHLVPNKKDPKYQTLPYNTKFLVQKQKNDEPSENSNDEVVGGKGDSPIVSNKENVSFTPTTTASTSAPVNIKMTTHSISNLTPKPYVNSMYGIDDSSGGTNTVSTCTHNVSKIPLPTPVLTSSSVPVKQQVS